VIISIALLLHVLEVVCLFYLAHSLVILAGIFTFLSFTGYLYEANPLYLTLKFSTAMAVHTSILLIMSCMGCLLVRPEQGLMKTMNGGVKVYHLAEKNVPPDLYIAETVPAVNIQSCSAVFFCLAKR
jgi:hypothetical protein